MERRHEANGSLEVCFVFKIGNIRARLYDNWNNAGEREETCLSEELRWARKN